MLSLAEKYLLQYIILLSVLNLDGNWYFPSPYLFSPPLLTLPKTFAFVPLFLSLNYD